MTYLEGTCVPELLQHNDWKRSPNIQFSMQLIRLIVLQVRATCPHPSVKAFFRRRLCKPIDSCAEVR